MKLNQNILPLLHNLNIILCIKNYLLDYKLNIGLFCLLIITCLGSPVFSQAKLLPLRDTRIGFGLHVSYHVPVMSTNLNGEKLERRLSNSYWDGQLKNVSGGIVADLFSPNAILGLHVGALYVRKGFSLVGWRAIAAQDDFLSQTLEVPLCLKIRTGSDEKVYHIVGLAGATYSAVLNFSHYTYDDVLLSDKKYGIDPYWGWILGAGLETVLSRSRLTGQPIQQRVILYITYTRAVNNIFNEQYTKGYGGLQSLSLAGLDARYGYFALTLSYMTFGKAKKRLP